MAAWELGTVALQMRESASDAWVAAPSTWSVDIGESLLYRMAFFIVNGDDVINAGNMQLERRVDGGAWEEVFGEYGKNMEPGYTTGGELGAVFPPDWKYGTAYHRPEWGGLLVEYRSAVEWDTSGTSLHHDVSVSEVVAGPEDLTDSGDLAEFFRSEDHGVIATIGGGAPRLVRGIFDDPGRVALRVHGTRPALLCERAQVSPVLAGDPLALADSARTFTIRGKHRDTDLTRMVLEETT